MPDLRIWRIRVLEQKSGKLGILPDMHPGKFVDLLELLESVYYDFRVVISVFAVFFVFGAKRRI